MKKKVKKKQASVHSSPVELFMPFLDLFFRVLLNSMVLAVTLVLFSILHFPLQIISLRVGKSYAQDRKSEFYQQKKKKNLTCCYGVVL